MAVTTASKATQNRALAECGVGAIPTTLATTLTAQEFGGNAPSKQTLLTLSAMPYTITDALAYAGLLIYTFPAGYIVIEGCVASLTFTTTSALASTLNTGVTVQYGLGTVTASATTLATTMININPGTGQSVPTFTSSTTVNVAPATVTSFLIAVTTPAAAAFDGHTTAIGCYLNTALATGTDIDGDSTLTITGTITITWKNLGDL